MKIAAGGGYNSELGTLDECNGRNLKTNKTITNEYDEKVSEQEFFQFEYAYFITKNFPYFLAKYNGIIESTNNNNSDCSGHGVTWVQELDHRQKVVIN